MSCCLLCTGAAAVRVVVKLRSHLKEELWKFSIHANTPGVITVMMISVFIPSHQLLHILISEQTDKMTAFEEMFFFLFRLFACDTRSTWQLYIWINTTKKRGISLLCIKKRCKADEWNLELSEKPANIFQNDIKFLFGVENLLEFFFRSHIKHHH